MIEYSVRYDPFARRWLVVYRWPTEGNEEPWQDAGETHAHQADAETSAAAGNAVQAQRKAARVEAMASTVACPTCTQVMTYWHGDHYCFPCENAVLEELSAAEQACDWHQPADNGDTGSTFDTDNAHHAVIVTWYERWPVAGACVVAYPIEQDAAAGEFVDELWSYGYEPTCTYLTRIQTVALVEALTTTLTDTTF